MNETEVTIRSKRLGGDFPAIDLTERFGCWAVHDPETGHLICDYYSTLDEVLEDLDAVVVE